MNELDEYIIQKFPSNKTGRLESHLAYKCRLFWIRNDFPTAKVVAEACGTTAGNVKNYKDYYNWKKIQDHIVFLREKEKQEKFSQYQEDTIKNLQEVFTECFLLNYSKTSVTYCNADINNASDLPPPACPP